MSKKNNVKTFDLGSYLLLFAVCSAVLLFPAIVLNPMMRPPLPSGGHYLVSDAEAWFYSIVFFVFWLFMIITSISFSKS